MTEICKEVCSNISCPHGGAYLCRRYQHLAELEEKLKAELLEAEQRAWDSLSRYKFQMFGYWAAIWVHLNRTGNFNRPNPWREIVKVAKTAATND